MAEKLLLEIVTPDRKVLSEEVEYVGAPGMLGEFGVMPNHIPFLSALGIGSLYYKAGGKTFYAFIAGGFAEVGPEKVTVLAEVAEKAEEIDESRAQKAKDRAEQRLQQQKDNMNFARSQAALRRSLARLTCRTSGRDAGTCN